MPIVSFPTSVQIVSPFQGKSSVTGSESQSDEVHVLCAVSGTIHISPHGWCTCTEHIVHGTVLYLVRTVQNHHVSSVALLPIKDGIHPLIMTNKFRQLATKFDAVAKSNQAN